MNKWFALICIGILLFSCLPTLAETNKTFDHRQLSRLDGYEYSASDKSWKYYVSTYCMGQKSPNFFTDTHLIHLAIKANGNANTEDVDTIFTVMAMNSNGTLEDIEQVTLIFKVNSNVINIVVNGSIGFFTPDDKEALKYLSEGNFFQGYVTLKNSSSTISFYPTNEEMDGIKEAAKILYNANITDYVSGFVAGYYSDSITFTVTQ